MTTASLSLLNPQTPLIPDHELLRRIGGGSYGEVWLARNVVGTWRAVKVVRRATFERAEHFDREFRGIQRFEPISRSHEGFVDILQIGRNDEAGYFYYVMELADGLGVESERVGKWESEKDAPNRTSTTVPIDPQTYSPKTLRTLLFPPADFPTFSPAHRNRLPVPDCVRIGVTLASALAHLHQQGLVHRDIKPSNIIFVGGVPKLADIGLVVDTSEAKSFVGTVGFIPPEGPGSPQADLYSLGKVLYEISTGQDRQDFPALPPDLLRGAPGSAGVSPAFSPQPRRSRPVLRSSTAEGGREEAQSNPELGTRNSELEVSALIELNEVLLKSCHRDLRQRYSSANAMLADLELLQRGQSVQRKHTAERRWLLARHFALAMAVIALLAIAVSLLWNRFKELAVPRVNGVPEVNSIAVLPFVNGDTEEQHEYLAAMLSDETRNALMNCSGLRVAPRQAALTFKHATNNFREVGEQLGVRTLLAGSMKKTSNQLYAAVRLINVADAAELWSATYDRYRRSTNVLVIASQVVSNVAQVLKVSFPLSALRQTEANFTRKLAAYRFYSQALSNAWNTQEGNDRAVQLLNQAIAEDPECAHAHALLAFCYSDAAGWLMHPKQAMTAAKVNALRAVQLNDSISKAHLSLAAVFAYHEWEPAKAEAEFQHALEVAPRDGNVYGYYATFLSFLGRFNDAEQMLLRGDQVDPRSHNLLGGWCWRFYCERHYDRMLDRADRLRTFHSNSVVGLMFQAKAHERLRNYDKALAIAQQMVQRDPAPDFVGFLGMVHGRMGHREEAQAVLDKLRAFSDIRRGVPLWDAQVLLGLGQIDAAIEKLRMAVEDYPPAVLSLKMDPLWDELRSNPRFWELLKNVVLPK